MRSEHEDRAHILAAWDVVVREYNGRLAKGAGKNDITHVKPTGTRVTKRGTAGLREAFAQFLVDYSVDWDG
ncbi:MAG: hypothetical protein HYX87_07965 [Chloroflexi bacterium]|nr:hypothetical protein [Chloroflexota bacterium]